MIPYEVDPSLHPAQPAPVQLDDGFSPPGTEQDGKPTGSAATEPVDAALWDKSEF